MAQIYVLSQVQENFSQLIFLVVLILVLILGFFLFLQILRFSIKMVHGLNDSKEEIFWTGFVIIPVFILGSFLPYIGYILASIVFVWLIKSRHETTWFEAFQAFITTILIIIFTITGVYFWIYSEIPFFEPHII